MNIPLHQRKCAVQCPAGPLPTAETESFMRQLDSGWTLRESRRIEKEFRFPDFRQALDFVNRVGTIAESENHHPDIALSWGKVQLTLWTHRAGGLTESDFIVAAKIDALPQEKP